MGRMIKWVLIFVLLFSIYHLIRDILQILDVNFFLTSAWHRPHNWCSPYCGQATFTLDIAGILISVIGLRRGLNKIIASALIILLLLWLLMSLLP